MPFRRFSTPYVSRVPRRQTTQALAALLGDTRQAATKMRQNIKATKGLFVGHLFDRDHAWFAGRVFTGIRTQNRMDDRLDRIEQGQRSGSAPGPPAPTHKGKGSSPPKNKQTQRWYEGRRTGVAALASVVPSFAGSALHSARSSSGQLFYRVASGDLSL